MPATAEGSCPVPATTEGNWIVPATAEGSPVPATAEGSPVPALTATAAHVLFENPPTPADDVAVGD